MDNPQHISGGESGRPAVALIAGPTASGKSALAIALAKATDGIVINADASQVYADLRILSARPSDEEIGDVPHRLFGHIDGAIACSAAQWAIEARAEIAAAHATGRLPILVGGTGLYIRTLIEGIAPVPEIAPDIRAEVRAMSTPDAYAALLSTDPHAASRLAPADTSRIMRALEVVRSTGIAIGEWRARKEGGIGHQITLSPLILLPPRPWLIERCDRRFAEMVQQGAAEEVRQLVARNLPDDLPVMRAIGVREIAAWDAGDIDHDTMLERGRIATRQYAKRQYTWFANQPPESWPRERGEIDNKFLGQFVRKLQH